MAASYYLEADYFINLFYSSPDECIMIMPLVIFFKYFGIIISSSFKFKLIIYSFKIYKETKNKDSHFATVIHTEKNTNP